MMMTSGEKVGNRIFLAAISHNLLPQSQVQYKNFIDAGRQIAAKEGVKALFSASFLYLSECIQIQ